MPGYLLDTDICIAALKNNPQVISRLQSLFGQVFVSSVSCHELFYGIEKGDPARRPEKVLKLRLFLQGVTVLDFDHLAAMDSAKVRESLRRGQQIGAYDTLLAGHARSAGLVMVTHNCREFFRVPDLAIEDWLNVGD